MSIRNDLKILYHLVLRPVRGKNHAERMESFYSGQAEGYDDFRKRLLQGREHVYQTLGQSNPEVWVDFGGGTGANLNSLDPVSRLSEKSMLSIWQHHCLGLSTNDATETAGKMWRLLQATQLLGPLPREVLML